MPEERRRSREFRGQIDILPKPDEVIAHLAALQSGRVSRRQLVATGVSPDAIDRRIANGRLMIVQRGVYAVGFAATGVRERWAAALLRVGPESMLSNFASAAAWRIRLPPPAVVDVATTRRLDPTAPVA
jgi:hypothetical protein